MTDPTDDTQPPASGSTSPTNPTSPAAPAGPPRPSETPSTPPSAGSSLKVDPDRPASDWREPPWFPPKAKDRGPNLASLVVGLVLVAIGLYFFLDRTLGIAMPRVQWSTIWPVILIGIGFVVLIRSVKRGS